MRTTMAVAIGVVILGVSSLTRADDGVRTMSGREIAGAQAYVRRMTDAGRPELAEAHAKAVLDYELTDPLSKAVVASMRAKRGEVEGAISGIATAVMFGSDEPFVRRTAGQILAWHDTRAGSMADDIEASLETMRRTVAETPECAEAYEQARDAYLAARAAAAGTAQPATTLVPDSVPADFAGDADNDAVIYTSALAFCSTSWSCASPSYWGACCSAVLRTCSPRVFDFGRYGARFATGRTNWGGGYAAYRPLSRLRTTWSTPLGSFSRSVWRGSVTSASTACAPAPSCPPVRSGRSYRGRSWR